jgi:hypothetical protein
MIFLTIPINTVDTAPTVNRHKEISSAYLQILYTLYLLVSREENIK